MLESFQWTMRFWDQYYSGGEYDAAARRKAAGGPTAATPAPTPTWLQGEAPRGKRATVAALSANQNDTHPDLLRSRTSKVTAYSTQCTSVATESAQRWQ